jgi:hypothetical protein
LDRVPHAAQRDIVLPRKRRCGGLPLQLHLLYRALSRFGGTHAVGFLHVPPLEAIDLPTQQRLLAEILEAIEA